MDEELMRLNASLRSAAVAVQRPQETEIPQCQ